MKFLATIRLQCGHAGHQSIEAVRLMDAVIQLRPGYFYCEAHPNTEPQSLTISPEHSL